MKNFLLFILQVDSETNPPRASLLQRVSSYLELSLLFERPYITYTLGVSLMNVGYFVPYFHLVAHSRQAGFSEYQAAFVMSAAGASDILGRVASGWFSDLGLFRLIHLLSMWTFLAGVFIMLLPVSSLSGSYAALMVISLLYGFSAGALTSVVFAVVPLIVGVERMMGGLGLLQLIESSAGLLGTPLSGRRLGQCIIISPNVGHVPVFYVISSDLNRSISTSNTLRVKVVKH